LSTTIPRSSGCTPQSNNGRAVQVENKHPRVSGCSVPDVVKYLFSELYDYIFTLLDRLTAYNQLRN